MFVASLSSPERRPLHHEKRSKQCFKIIKGVLLVGPNRLERRAQARRFRCVFAIRSDQLLILSVTFVPLLLRARTKLDHPMKPNATAAEPGVVGAVGRQRVVAQSVDVGFIAPRTAAQHALAQARCVFVLAPLPDIPSHVVNAESARTETSYRCRKHLSVVKSFDHWPTRYIISRRFKFGQPRHRLALFSEIISRVIRRRPLLAPRKDIRDFHILAPRRCIRILLISNADRATLLMIRWQPIRLAFLPAQPFAKRFRILPIQIHSRMFVSLRKRRLLPRSPGRVAKSLVVFHPCLPDAEEHIRSRHWHEFHG